jgi:hypothetical protein
VGPKGPTGQPAQRQGRGFDRQKLTVNEVLGETTTTIVLLSVIRIEGW